MLTTARRSRLFLLLLLTAAPIAGFGAYHVARTGEREEVHERFREYLAKQVASVEAEIGSSVEMLEYLAGLYRSSEFVTRREFLDFARLALARHPDIQAVEWAPRVTAQGREAHVARMRAEGFKDYAITHRGREGQLSAAPPSPELFPVTYIEAREGVEPSLGFDLASDAICSAALQRAVATGRPQLSDPVRLVHETTSSDALLVMLPIFRTAGTVTSDASDNPLGVVLLSWRVDNLLARLAHGVLDGTLRGDRVELRDARDDRIWLPLVADADRQGARSGDFRATARLEVAGRALRFGAAPGPAFMARSRSRGSILLGLLVWLLLTLAATGLGFREARERLAQEKRSLHLTRSLLRSLDQGVVVADKSGEIQLVNEAATRIVGGLEDTVARRGWAAVGVGSLVGDPASPEAPGTLPLARAVAGEHFEDEEFFVRRASATDGVWLLVSGAPLRSDRGEALGGVVVFHDITAAKAKDDSIRRLTAAVDQSADAIFVTDRVGKIHYVNRGFEGTTGFTRKQALGKTPRILNSGTHDAEHFRLMWDTILRGDVYRGTTVNRRKDGALWHGEQSVTPIRDTQGQVTHFVSVTKDMTERILLHEREAEMRVAGIIQQRLYPTDTPRVAGLDVAGVVYPAGVTCGDYFDVIPLPDDTVALVIGDVSGHGVGPALIMMEVRAHLRSLLTAGNSIHEALALLNELLCEDIPDDRFVSLLLVRFDHRTLHLAYANAGHPAGLVMGAMGAVRAELAPTGPALGLLQGATYGEGEPLGLHEGDVIALVTDGITEVHAPDGELYESERVLGTVRDQRGKTASGIVEALYDSAHSFAAGQETDDDLTLLVCKVKKAREPIATASEGPTQASSSV